jgi:transposase
MRELAVTLMTGPANEDPVIETRLFPATNRRIEELRTWLLEKGCRTVVMESTGSYWKPVFHLLEKDLQVQLANPLHVKNLRGHKTDVADSVWLAHLLRHGMVRASFIPPCDIRHLRDLTRRRKRLLGAGASEKNRIGKVLEDANVKLSSVLSSLFGVSGQAMLKRMLAGDFVPAELADLAQARARSKRPAIAEAIAGHHFDQHHRFLIRQSLDHIDFLETQIQRLDEAILKLLEPYREQYDLLQTIPGVKAETAAVIIAELGPDMNVFPTVGHATSWAGLCPGNNRSAGKQRSGCPTGGNRWMKSALVECSWSACRAKDSPFAAKYHRWQRTLGKKKAAMAISHALLRVAYFVLKERVPFLTYEGQTDQQQQRERQIRHHCRRLRELGVATDTIQQALDAFGVVTPEPKRKGPRCKGALGLKAY